MQNSLDKDLLSQAITSACEFLEKHTKDGLGVLMIYSDLSGRITNDPCDLSDEIVEFQDLSELYYYVKDGDTIKHKKANLKRREALLNKINSLDDYDLLIRLESFLDENF